MRGETVRRDEERGIVELGTKGDLLDERPAGGLCTKLYLEAPGNGGNPAETGYGLRPARSDQVQRRLGLGGGGGKTGEPLCFHGVQGVPGSNPGVPTKI